MMILVGIVITALAVSVLMLTFKLSDKGGLEDENARLRSENNKLAEELRDAKLENIELKNKLGKKGGGK